MADSALFVQSLEKGLMVLEAFRNFETLNLQEIAQACDITMGSAQRAAYTLEQCGYLEKDANTKRYRVTVRAVGLGYSYLARTPLLHNAHAVLHQMNQESGEIANLSVPNNEGDMVFVLRVPTSKHIPIYMPTGSRIPMLASASGRAILAHTPADELEEKLAKVNMQQHTPHTTTDMAVLRHLINEARESRYAYADEEFYRGDINVASAVIDEAGRPIAAVNISVPKPRWSLEHARENLGPLVVRAARALSRNVD